MYFTYPLATKLDLRNELLWGRSPRKIFRLKRMKNHDEAVGFQDNGVRLRHGIEEIIKELDDISGDVGANKILKGVSINEAVTDPEDVMQKLSSLKTRMAPFKKSVAELDRLLQELKEVALKECRELEDKIGALVDQKNHEMGRIESIKREIEGMPDKITEINRIITGDSNFIAECDHENDRYKTDAYEINLQNGACIKLYQLSEGTEYVGWDREERDITVRRDIKKPSKPHLHKISRKLKSLNEQDELPGDQRDIVIQELQNEIDLLNRKKDTYLPADIERRESEIADINDMIASLKIKIDKVKNRNQRMFPVKTIIRKTSKDVS